MITPDLINQNEQMISLHYPNSLKVLSSAVVGGGFGQYQYLVNRYVDKDYQCDDYEKEMRDFLKLNKFDPKQTIGMMTAVKLENMQSKFVEIAGMSLLVVVTAGVANAINATGGYIYSLANKPGTINTWVLVNGTLPDSAFIQAVITATEAKVKALNTLNVKDIWTGALATGTSTDSVLIGATQTGSFSEFAGPITPLGATIGQTVYDCTLSAIEKNEKSHRA